MVPVPYWHPFPMSGHVSYVSNSPCYSGCWRSRGTDSCQRRSWLCNLWVRGSISSWGHAWSRCRASAGSSPGLSCWDTTHIESLSILTGTSQQVTIREAAITGWWLCMCCCSVSKHCTDVELQSKHTVSVVSFSTQGSQSELWGRR